MNYSSLLRSYCFLASCLLLSHFVFDSRWKDETYILFGDHSHNRNVLVSCRAYDTPSWNSVVSLNYLIMTLSRIWPPMLVVAHMTCRAYDLSRIWSDTGFAPLCQCEILLFIACNEMYTLTYVVNVFLIHVRKHANWTTRNNPIIM